MSRVNDGGVEIVIDCQLFSIDAVQRAAFRFSDSCEVDIERNEQGFLVRLRPRDCIAPEMDRLKERYRSTLLDEQLREKVLAETRHIRDTLYTVAFARANAPPGTSAE